MTEQEYEIICTKLRAKERNKYYIEMLDNMIFSIFAIAEKVDRYFGYDVINISQSKELGHYLYKYTVDEDNDETEKYFSGSRNLVEDYPNEYGK